MIDLVGFIASVLLAIRFHEIPAIVPDFLGFSERWSAFIGGLAIFIPLIIFTALLGARMSKAVYKPGLFTLNRVLGAATAALLAGAIALVGMLFLRSAPLPFGIGNLVKYSAIAPWAIDQTEPAVVWLDDTLGLDLCGGRLAKVITEVCENDHVTPKSP